MLQSTMARFDLARLAEGFRRVGGDEVAELARRDFGGEPVTDEDSARVFAAFGPRLPDREQLGRRVGNPDIGEPGMELLRRFDVVDQLASHRLPDARVRRRARSSHARWMPLRRSFDALPEGIGRLEMIRGAGHFPWKDVPDRYFPLIEGFVDDVWGRPSRTTSP